jgi:hypothetical protein
MSIYKNIKNNSTIKLIVFLVLVSATIYLVAVFLDTFNKEYCAILEFIIVRLSTMLVLLIFFQLVSSLAIAKEISEEMETFNEGPDNVSTFMATLRKNHFLIFMFTLLFWVMGTTYFAEDYLLSYILGALSFIFSTLYLAQFVVYTMAYLKKPIKKTSSKSAHPNNKKQTRYMFTAASKAITGANASKAAVVCLECIKGGAMLLGFSEIGYKLTHGGMNDVSPWRGELLNRQFPDDRTGQWSESKAAHAIHNQAMGNEHDKIYEIKDVMGELKLKFPESKGK